MMEDTGPTASIILFMVLLLADIFLYGFEAAVSALNTKEVQKAAEEGDRKAVRLIKMIENPAVFMNTQQLIVTLIHLIMGGFYLGIWLKHIHRFIAQRTGGLLSIQQASALSLIVSTFILMYVLLTVGVLLPKKFASRYPLRWAYAFAAPVYYVTRALSPLTGLVTASAGVILRVFGIRDNTDNNDVTEDEIISMVNEGHEQGVLQASEAEMITNIFEFGDKEAADIMTHRKNIVAIDGSMPLRDACSMMLEAKNSRFPVYEENIDHIIGILHMKDAMRRQAQDENLNTPVQEMEGLIREARFIPQTRNVNALFQSMQSQKIQMVIVVDEYGQTCGLIAMEDILEEIVGNLLDEYDEDTSHIEQKGENVYEIDGMTPLEELEDEFGISFGENEFDTLNGFLISKMDKIPEEDEEFEADVDGYHFRVLSVQNKMIQRVLVTKNPVKEEKKEEEK